MSPVRFGGGSSSDSLPSGSGDFKFAEDANVDDRFGPVVALLDRAQVDDAIGLISPQFPEDASVDDLWRLNDLIPHWAEDFSADDFAKYRLREMNYGRSGTPDSDASGDAWINQASTAQNNGNAALSVKANVLSDERRGLLFFDLTRFAGLTALAGGSHTFRLHAAHDAATGSNNLRVRLSTLAAKPFTESTVTWASPTTGGPAEGTLVLSTTIAVTAGGTSPFSVTLSDANVNALLGNWVYVRLLSEATLGATIFTVQSRESTTVAWRPTLNLTLKR